MKLKIGDRIKTEDGKTGYVRSIENVGKQTQVTIETIEDGQLWYYMGNEIVRINDRLVW